MRKFGGRVRLSCPSSERNLKLKRRVVPPSGLLPAILYLRSLQPPKELPYIAPRLSRDASELKKGGSKLSSSTNVLT